MFAESAAGMAETVEPLGRREPVLLDNGSTDEYGWSARACCSVER